MKRSKTWSVWLLAPALGAAIVSAQSSPGASSGASTKRPVPSLGASAWMAVPTPFSARNQDDLLASLRSKRDRFWDDLIKAPEPLTPHPSFGTGMSEGDMVAGAPELPNVPNRIIITATFMKHRSILSDSQRSIYTEVSFLVGDVFNDQSGRTITHGQDITVGLAGGSILTPSGESISYLVQPRKLFLQPDKKYLLVLSYKPDVDFYTAGDFWDISDGTVQVGSIRNELLRREGRSSLLGITVDQLPQALSELLAQTD